MSSKSPPSACGYGVLIVYFLYLEHVEIFPIQLKLDYKPKRVDYRALREGKTIALMNFFHFDAADITLRRITLSGVSVLISCSF